MLQINEFGRHLDQKTFDFYFKTIRLPVYIILYTGCIIIPMLILLKSRYCAF